MDSRNVTQETFEALGRREAHRIVDEIREGCRLHQLEVGGGAILEPGDGSHGGYRILIDIYMEGMDTPRVQRFIEDMGLGHRHVRREWGTYLMIYKP
jgi:hypothetical protein